MITKDLLVIGGRKLLPSSHRIDLRKHPAGALLKPG